MTLLYLENITPYEKVVSIFYTDFARVMDTPDIWDRLHNGESVLAYEGRYSYYLEYSTYENGAKGSTEEVISLVAKYN